jgi:hypothetical protein
MRMLEEIERLERQLDPSRNRPAGAHVRGSSAREKSVRTARATDVERRDVTGSPSRQHLAHPSLAPYFARKREALIAAPVGDPSKGYEEGTGLRARAGAVGLADFLKLPCLAAKKRSRADAATRRSRPRTSLVMKGSPVRVRASALADLQGFLWLANEQGPVRGTSGVHSATPSRSMIGSAMLFTLARFAGVVRSPAS